MEAIRKFDGEYRFLSNFWNLQNPVEMGDVLFSSVETAYVAAKTSNHHLRFEISAMKPGHAKRTGKAILADPNLCPNRWWSDDFRLRLMRDLVAQKFLKNDELAQLLRETGSRLLIEGNTWHDNFFGVCSCGNCPTEKINPNEGNNLGKILMEVRLII